METRPATSQPRYGLAASCYRMRKSGLEHAQIGLQIGLTEAEVCEAIGRHKQRLAVIGRNSGNGSRASRRHGSVSDGLYSDTGGALRF